MKQKPKKAKARASKIMGRLFPGDKMLHQEVEYASEGTDETGWDYDFYLGKISRSP